MTWAQRFSRVFEQTALGMMTNVIVRKRMFIHKVAGSGRLKSSAVAPGSFLTRTPNQRLPDILTAERLPQPGKLQHRLSRQAGHNHLHQESHFLQSHFYNHPRDRHLHQFC